MTLVDTWRHAEREKRCLMLAWLFERMRRLDRTQLVGVSLVSAVSLVIGLTAASAVAPRVLVATSHSGVANSRDAAAQTVAQQDSRAQAGGAVDYHTNSHPNILF